MKYVKIEVPLIEQAASMSCWYAAAVMIGNYYEVGPRRGLPQVWIANKGIRLDRFEDLARHEDLVFVQSANHEFTLASLSNALHRYGPMYNVCKMPQGNHAIVIVGCGDLDGEAEVFYNDPASGTEEKMSIREWNERRVRGYLMVRDPSTIPVGHYAKLDSVTM